jgi:hypothetical protein
MQLIRRFLIRVLIGAHQSAERLRRTVGWMGSYNFRIFAPSCYFKDKYMLNIKRSYARLGVRITAFALDYIIIVGYLIFVVAVGTVLNTFFPALAHRLFSKVSIP